MAKKPAKDKKPAKAVAERKATRPKQTQLPGTERQDRIPALEKAAVAYEEVRDQRQELTRHEVAAKTKLHDLMKEHKLTSYICDSDDLEVEIVPAKEESVKVKRRKMDEDEDGDE